MSLNNITLNSELLVRLYENELVELKEVQKVKPVFDHIGNNLKHILILAAENGNQISAPNFDFLNSIINACKLTIGDVAIITSLAPATFSYTNLNLHFKSKTVLLFGITPLEIDLPFNFPPFQIQNFDGCTYLSAPQLTEIRTDVAIKTKLWKCLKTLFEI